MTPNSHRDLFLHARAFHKAAQALAASLRPDDNLLADFDVSPVVFMYRHAIELFLKTLVLGEGGNFLARKPDHISVSKTHSVSWLAQFVCQIVTALKWEQEFRCEGIETLADFRAAIEEVNAVDPGFHTFRCPADPHSASSVREFVKKADAVIGLLSSSADALAAEWDLQSGEGGSDAGCSGGGFEPTIQ
jgi:hypothetical protein